MESFLTVEGPGDSAPIVMESNELLASAEALVIVDEATLRKAHRWLVDAVEIDKKAVKHCAKTKKASHDLHVQICADEKELRKIPQRIREVLEPKILAHQRAEREKAAKIAEVNRLAAVKAEEESRLAKALALEAAGHPEIAEASIDAPMPAPRPASHYAPPPVKLEGTATKKTLDFRIVNPDAVGRDYCDPSEKRIRDQVRSTGMKAVQTVGGIEVFEVESLAVRGRK